MQLTRRLWRLPILHSHSSTRTFLPFTLLRMRTQAWVTSLLPNPARLGILLSNHSNTGKRVRLMRRAWRFGNRFRIRRESVETDISPGIPTRSRCVSGISHDRNRQSDRPGETANFEPGLTTVWRLLFLVPLPKISKKIFSGGESGMCGTTLIGRNQV